MTPSPGSSIGPYQVVDRIGAGGMGQVLRARDIRLNRTVALKVLGESAPGDRGRKMLLREAQAASALNHPNIVTVYDVVSQDGCDVIVMEYVKGTTLADRIGQGLPLAEALPYLIQIASALAAAHAAGIVHRDVKPRNVMVAEAGLVKVLDFGLAHVERPLEMSEETATVTASGTIVGTYLYMSPEQAQGKKVDARSDVFAFGSLLYEMMAGRPAFGGDSPLEILSAIVRSEPPSLRAVREDVPVELERLLQRCWRKDAAQRMHSMEDVRLLLEELRDEPAAAHEAASAPRRRRRIGTAVLATAAIAAGAAAWLYLQPSPGPDLSAYRLTPFATEAGEETAPAWSPDGRTLAYEYVVDGVRQIYARGLEAPSGTRVTNSAADCLRPFWSPDGNSIYYISKGQLWSVSPAGGAPRMVLGNVAAAAISPDSATLVFARGNVGDSQLWIASPPGSEPHRYELGPFSDRLAQISSPQFAADGSKLIVVVSRQAAVAAPELWMIPFPSGAPSRMPLRREGTQGRPLTVSWMPDSRHLVFSVDHLFLADSRSAEVRQITASTSLEFMPSASPDGRRIAFASGTVDSDLVQMTLDGSSSKPLLATSRDESYPVWSPLRPQYAYVTTASGVPEIWLRDVPDSGARPVVRPDAPSDWYDIEKLNFAPDGQHISFDRYGDRHVVAIASVAGGRPVIPDSQSTNQHGISWSPDGNWIAYRRLIDAKWELVKRPLGGGDAVRLDEASQGGAATAWSPAGEWILHPVGATMRLVSQDGSRHVTIPGGPWATYGFSKDGSTVYAVRRNAARKWELAAYEVPAGREKSAVPLDVPVSAMVAGFSASPDGKSFLTSVSRSLFDIWLLEGALPARRRFFR